MHVEYYEHKLLFESEKLDMAVCGSFTIGCIDAAITSKLPVVITTAMGCFAGK